ncbi:expressed unknown protein [Seminavis robusta]|uniref:Uncharacterized protein n=1 Tax=Seminavis robusta TaxID=568900 RepID=A0A9N8EQ49_9STRA|nr:expressed unknown protein [Seminavis robusta]|eukprot:Sro1375_g267320.1 n/a (125) ;mRNA; f:5923-6297
MNHKSHILLDDEEAANDDKDKDYRQFPDVATDAVVHDAYHSFGAATPKKQVDKKIFLPLYAATASCLILLPVLPLFLRVILVTAWAILFIWTPLYYLYHYDPDNQTDASCCSSACCAQDNTLKT